MSRAAAQPISHGALLSVLSSALWAHPGSLRGSDAQEAPWGHPRDASPFLSLLASL